MVINDLHNSFLPFIAKYYPIRKANTYEAGELSESQTRLAKEIFNSKYSTHPEILLNNFEFENQITIQMMWVNFSLYHYDQQQLKYSEIIAMINKEVSSERLR